MNALRGKVTKKMMKNTNFKTTRLRTWLYLASAVILLTGIMSAVLLYLSALNDEGADPGYEVIGGFVYPGGGAYNKKYIHDLQLYGGNAVLVFAVVMLLLWLIVASGMRAPEALMTRIYHLPQLDEAAASALRQSLAQLRGVREVLVVANEQTACLKVEMGGFDEDAVEYLVKGV